ncbi:hypothetical protein CAP35_06890 [Chitinophagaceae bacterium IBVUCB1]|nr:hypothetical protein CAP35_06890 [Chitinophagaceae bacterium IBVUCB1]
MDLTITENSSPFKEACQAVSMGWDGLKPLHQTFITHYLHTRDKRQAYKQTYPHVADGNSLRSAANRLYKQLQPHIAHLEQRATALAMDELLAATKEQIKTELCSMERRRQELAKIITGQMRVKRHIRLRDRIVEVYDDVSPAALIRAIDLDSRLAANKYKEKLETKKPQDKAPLLFLGGDAAMTAEQVMAAGVVKPDPPLEELLKQYPYGDAYWMGRCIRVPAKDVERLGFDTLDDGVPYLNNNLTDEYHKLRIQREMDYLKEHQPAVYQDILIKSKEKIHYQDVYEEETPAEPVITEPTTEELWKQYLVADSNTRRLPASDRDAKERWFKLIPRKQQLKLIEVYSKTG